MPIDLPHHYEEIAEATRNVRKESLADLAPVDAAHASLEEVSVWQKVLKDRPEAVVFVQIVSGLELGLFALVSGLYRQAYGSLRLAVELVAALSWFSTHRLDLAEWQAGDKDLVWREITNIEEGILSPRYRKAFFPELNEEKKYNSLYKKLYRELSEHVHGNARTWAGPDDINFDRALHDEWLDKLQTFMLVTNVLLSLRYLQEISTEQLRMLESILRSRVPQVAAITKYLDERLPTVDPAGPATTVVDSAPDPPAVTRETPEPGEVGAENMDSNPPEVPETLSELKKQV